MPRTRCTVCALVALILLLCAASGNTQLTPKEREFLRKNEAKIDALVKNLLDAKDKPVRAILLKKNKALVTTAIVKILISASNNMITDGALPEADKLATLAVEAAEVVKDRPLLAGCVYLKAYVLREMKRPVDAIIQFRRAATLHQQIKDLPHEADCYFNVGALLLELGKPADAVTTLQKCIALHAQTKDRAAAANAYNLLGNAFERLKEYSKAIAAYDKSLATVLALGDKANAAIVSANIAKIHLLNNRREAALPFLQKSLVYHTEAGNKSGIAEALLALGDFYADDRRYDTAIEHFSRALATADEAADKTLAAEASGRIGGIAYRTNDFIAARDAFKRAVDLYKEIGDAAQQAVALDGYGLSVYALGDYDLAILNFSLSFGLYDRLKNTRGVLKEVNNLSLVFFATGQYAKAIEFLQFCNEQMQHVNDPELTTAVLNNLGAVFFATGQIDKARSLYENALKTAEAKSDKRMIARASVNLAKCFGPKETAKAKAHYERSLAVAREIKDDTVEAVALAGLAEMYEGETRSDQQIATLKQCLEIAVRIANPALEANTQMQLGGAFRRASRLDEATEVLNKAVATASRVGAPEVEADALNELGLVRRDQKNWDEAIRTFKQAIAVQEKLRANTLEPSLQISRSAGSSAHSPYYNLILCQMETQTTDDDIFAYSEMTKARELVNLLQNGKVSPTKGMTPEQKAEEQKLRSTVFSWNEMLEGANTDTTRERLRRALREAQDKYEVFRQTLYLSNPALQTRRGDFQPISVADLNKSLFAANPDLCVLSFITLEQETLVFFISRGEDSSPSLVIYRLPIPAQDIFWYVAQAHASVSSHDGSVRSGLPTRAKLDIPDEFEKPSYQDAGKALHSLLIAPLEERLKEKKHLVIVPDGPLAELPFQALIGSDGKYLCERFAISYAPSVTALARILSTETGGVGRAAPTNSLFALGNPTYSPKWSLPALPGTDEEVESIGKLCGEGAVTLAGMDATETSLKTKAADARIVHLATHGLLNTAAPLFSSIALTPDKTEDGMLYARELMDIDLRADLAVLSACQTALGEFADGEGVLGLGWALYVAGAPAAVLSQWSVADASTSELMVAFYRHLRSGSNKANALQAAQLELIRSEKYSHPYYWAPFILTGDWR